jgi:hypothetical protein
LLKALKGNIFQLLCDLRFIRRIPLDEGREIGSDLGEGGEKFIV